jgi:hypothetical protein
LEGLHSLRDSGKGCVVIHRHKHSTLAALLMSLGCSFDTDVWVTSGWEDSSTGEAHGETHEESSTGLGATGMQTGLDSSTGHGQNSTTTSAGTSSESSASGGSTGAPFCEHDGPVCMCGGEVVDPSECGCFEDPRGWCTCPDGSIEEPCYYPPTDPCHVVDGACECDGVPADPDACGCFFDATGACVCDDGQAYPPETCAPPPPVCTVELLGGLEQCVCDNVPADPIECGCVWSGMCFCNGAIEEAIVCGPLAADPVDASCGCRTVGAMCLCPSGETYPANACAPC